MKLTSSQLRKIIREELESALVESSVESKWLDMNTDLVNLMSSLGIYGIRPSAFLEELFLGGQLAKEDAAEVSAMLHDYKVTPEELTDLIKHGKTLYSRGDAIDGLIRRLEKADATNVLEVAEEMEGIGGDLKDWHQRLWPAVKAKMRELEPGLARALGQTYMENAPVGDV